jgi:hypothetical protein
MVSEVLSLTEVAGVSYSEASLLVFNDAEPRDGVSRPAAGSAIEST